MLKLTGHDARRRRGAIGLTRHAADAPHLCFAAAGGHGERDRRAHGRRQRGGAGRGNCGRGAPTCAGMHQNVWNDEKSITKSSDTSSKTSLLLNHTYVLLPHKTLHTIGFWRQPAIC